MVHYLHVKIAFRICPAFEPVFITDNFSLFIIFLLLRPLKQQIWIPDTFITLPYAVCMSVIYDVFLCDTRRHTSLDCGIYHSSARGRYSKTFQSHWVNESTDIYFSSRYPKAWIKNRLLLFWSFFLHLIKCTRIYYDTIFKKATSWEELHKPRQNSYDFMWRMYKLYLNGSNPIQSRRIHAHETFKGRHPVIHSSRPSWPYIFKKVETMTG